MYSLLSMMICCFCTKFYHQNDIDTIAVINVKRKRRVSYAESDDLSMFVRPVAR